MQTDFGHEHIGCILGNRKNEGHFSSAVSQQIMISYITSEGGGKGRGERERVMERGMGSRGGYNWI